MMERELDSFKFIDINYLVSNTATLADTYQKALPFPHLVIDNFLTKTGLRELDISRLNSVPSSDESSSDYFFAKSKIENPHFDRCSQPLNELKSELLSNEFQSWLRKVCGLEVFLDEAFTGGGLHQGGAGSYLEMHSDFTKHPNNRKWIRELNLLLYLNRDYKSSWKGALDLEHRDTGKKNSIDPIENRMVIMLSKPHTLHGYQSIAFPDGYLRTSIAAYAYTIDDGIIDIPYKSTVWVPNKGVKRFIAPIFNYLVPIKQKLLGSRTAKRALKDKKQQ